MTLSLTDLIARVERADLNAESIADSPQVLSVFAAPEWAELHEDGQAWVRAVIAETRDRLAAYLRAVAERGGAEELLAKLIGVAHGVGLQAGVPAQDIVGLIVSHLGAHPEHLPRFLAEGTELLIDGTITPETGCLSYRAECGDILTPA